MTNAPAAFAALRIARRDAWRHKARSCLVVLMIALPVLGLTSADVLARTMQLSPTQGLDREIGRADVALQLVGGSVEQAPDAVHANFTITTSAPQVGKPLSSAALLARAEALLPAASRVIRTFTDSGEIGANGRLVSGNVNGIDLADPLTSGIADKVSGRVPAAASEVAVTPRLADRLGIGLGDHVTVGGIGRTVVGVYQNPSSLRDVAVYGPTTALPRGQDSSVLYLASTTRPISWPTVQRFDQMGVVATSRYAVEHPPAHTGYQPVGDNHAEVIGIATVGVGLAVLEVVLLAGAAFAVGARRQRRDLALVSAGGGDAGHIRSIVLAGGVVLGLTGTVLGLAAGVAAARLLLPIDEHLAGRLAGPFDLRGLELLAIAVLGLVTGLAASILPARAAANDDVVAGLTGRRGIVSTARRIPMVGLSMAVLGFVVAAYAASPPARFTLILVGAVISELGFIICSSAIVGLAGRLARFLPLAPRLALRDAARHRGRTGPAVAAIMAAVAGSIAVSTYMVSENSFERATYTPQARIGQPVLIVNGDNAAARQHNLVAATSVARSDLAASAVVPLPTSSCSGDGDERCTFLLTPNSDQHVTTQNAVAVGGPALLARLAGRSDRGAQAALEEGKVVVFSPGWLSRGQASLNLESTGPRDTSHTARLPAYLLDAGKSSAATGAIISPTLAARLKLTTDHTEYLVVTPTVPTQVQQDRADAALTPASIGAATATASLTIERGYPSQRLNYGLLALAAAAAIVTLGATGITTGLSAAESRPDLITLSAVGSSPRTRRLLVANQAGSVALLGTIVGVVSGLVPAYGVLRSREGFPMVLPWQTIAAVVVGVPLLAMLATALCVSTRSTLIRRAS